MLNPKLITIGKLKLAYELSQIDVDGLYKELLPDNVYPLVLWETAYNEHWLWSLKSNAQCYGIDIPQFPDTSPLPEKYFTYFIHSHSINSFFDELRIKTKIDALERGIDYIIECTYGIENFPFEEEKKDLFASLHEEERLIQNWQRKSGPLVIHFMESTNYGFISNLLFDSVAVDKRLSIKFFSDYTLKQEVKGITFALVESIIKSSKHETPQKQTTASPSTGSRKNIERIKATHQVCEELAIELLQERQLFENDRNTWKPNLLRSNGKTNWDIFTTEAMTRLGDKPHRVAAREVWEKIPGDLKHNGRMPEQ